MVPGSYLKILRQDDRIPILLVQNSIDSTSNHTNGNGNPNLRPLHGWTLIVPKGWGMPFFSSLNSTDSRVGGQRERSTQYFEAGCPVFPCDYPTSRSYEEFLREAQKSQFTKWERKPPAKRSSWDSLDTKKPCRRDCMKILNLGTQMGNCDLLSTQREGDELKSEKDVGPWLLRGPKVKSILDILLQSDNRATSLKSQLYELRSRRFQESLWGIHEASLLKFALVMVSLNLQGRGSPQEFALISPPSQKELDGRQTKYQQDSTKINIEQINDMACDEVAFEDQSTEIIIGYVTSGRYSFSVGRGRALGVISLSHYLQLLSIADRSVFLFFSFPCDHAEFSLSHGCNLPLVRVRNRHCTNYVLAFANLINQ